MSGIAKGWRKLAYWLVAFALGLAVMGTNIPSPLYGVYRGEWGFSAGILTLIFAVYALALIPTLLVFGNLSDRVGRRRVVLVGLVAIAVGSLIFSFAQGLGWLFIARVVQGVAVGLVSGAATAALAELHPRADRRVAALTATVALTGGSGVGPLFGGLLAQYASYPLVVPYLAHLGLSILAALGILTMMPETVETEDGARSSSWRLQRPRIPSQIRRPFAVGSAACFIGWAVVGLFLAIIPSYVSDLLHSGNLALEGGVVFMMLGSASVAQLVLREVPLRQAVIFGAAALMLGLAAIVVAVPAGFAWLLFGGTILNGVGLGLAFMGGLGLVGKVAPPESRAETMSACYVVIYLGVSLPVLGVGFLAGAVGLFAAVATFAVAIGLVAVGVAGSALTSRKLS